MDFEKLKKMTEIVLEKVKQKYSKVDAKYKYHTYTGAIYYQLSSYVSLRAQVTNVFNIAGNLLKDHNSYFYSIKNLVSNYNLFTLSNAQDALEHILEIIEIEENSEIKIKEMKIFESAEDKLNQAGISFREGEYPSVFNNLNTALELILKDKIEIPTTLKGINTSNVIELLVKEKVYCYQYLDEAKRRVVLIDNKTKHVGYTPSKPECISALKVMEELIFKLKNKEIKISEELRNKIFENLYDKKGKK